MLKYNCTYSFRLFDVIYVHTAQLSLLTYPERYIIIRNTISLADRFEITSSFASFYQCFFSFSFQVSCFFPFISLSDADLRFFTEHGAQTFEKQR